MLTSFHHALALVASQSSENNGGAFGLIFLLSGPVFYWVIYLKYRNVNQRHHYESETQATKLNVRTADDFVKSEKGLSNSKMHGANNTEVRGAGGLAGMAGMAGGLAGMAGQFGSMLSQAQHQAQQQQHPAEPPVSPVPPPPVPATPPPPPEPPAPPGGDQPGGSTF